MNNIIIFSSIMTLNFVIILIAYIYKTFSPIDINRSSCMEQVGCSAEYDLSVSGIPISTPLCSDSVRCKSLRTPDQKAGISLPDFIKDHAKINPTCVEVGDSEVCCVGNIKRCLGNRALLSGGADVSLVIKALLGGDDVSPENHSLLSGDDVSLGYSIAFNSTMCRALPSCFIENDESPYLLFPVPDMSVNLYSKPDTDHDFDFFNLDKTIATGFGLLGACAISPNQAMIYVIELPPYADISYFSLTPYLFQTGREAWVNNYPQDTPFASMTDSFNLHSLREIGEKRDDVRNWMNGDTQSLTITVCAAVSKEAVEHVRPSIVKNGHPFVVMPIPAGSTYGDSYGPDDEILLKENRFNKDAFKEDTKLFDWRRDTMAIVGRIADKGGGELGSWKDDFSKQYKSNVYCVTTPKVESYDLFKLADQNGSYNGSNTFTQAEGDGFTVGKWRRKAARPSVDPEPTLSSAEVATTSWMAKHGFNRVRQIGVNSNPSPFSYYNKHVGKLGGGDDYTWNQSGLSILQYNVAAFGDCRDTLYPSSNTFCMGPQDILVVIGNDYTALPGVDIAYNNLNVYDSQSQTSLASLRGSGKASTYALAVARRDHTCMFKGDDSPAEFQFIPTGSHSNLGAAPTTSFFTQSRFYMQSGSGTSPNFSTSQQNFKVLLFSPCGSYGAPPYPVKCHDVLENACYPNESIIELGGYGEWESGTEACDEDLEADARIAAKRSDDLTAGICSKFRSEKTSRLRRLNILYYIAAATMVSITILIFHTLYTTRNIPNRKHVLDFLLPFAIPLFVSFVTAIVSSDLIAKTTETSGYNINETKKQA